MYCMLCKRYTKGSNDNTCGHYAPYKTYVEPYKQGFRIYQYSGGLRSAGVKKLLDKRVFSTKEEANFMAWILKNNP